MVRTPDFLSGNESSILSRSTKQERVIMLNKNEVPEGSEASSECGRNSPAPVDCPNCFEGKSDMDHTCRVCDAAKMMPVHCTPTESEGRIFYEHTSEPIPNADGFVLYAASADQFRTAAKMMAVQPACMTCTAPAPAEVPMPDTTDIAGYTPQALRDYGDDREAAGYARGLRDAGRDAVPVVQNGEVLVTVAGPTGSGKSAIAGEIEIMCRALGLDAEWVGGAAEKHLTHADWTESLEMYRPRVRIVEANIPRTDAALRGEVPMPLQTRKVIMLNKNEAPEGFEAVELDFNDPDIMFDCQTHCALANMNDNMCMSANCFSSDRQDKKNVYFVRKE